MKRTAIAVSARRILGAVALVTAAVAALSLAPPTRAERVKIVRDSRGEPHIQAHSPAGAAYGFAYAQMQDQGTYILGAIAAATGRTAELIGPECQPSLQACFTRDQAAHLFRVPEVADEKYDTLPLNSRRRYKRFAQGINDYVRDHPDAVPAWAFHVNPQDIVAASEYGFVMSQAADVSAGAGAASRAGPSSLDRALQGAADEFGSRGASNGFVLAGSKTASGKSIVEGDPHLGFTGASQWYAAQIEYPGTSVEGVTFRGFPAIAIGSNGKVAWTHTANHGNQNEGRAYAERLQAGKPNSYLYGAGYRPMDVESVSIAVQTSPGAVDTVNVRFRYTVHGPVISDPPALVNGTQPAPRENTAVAATISEFEQVEIGTQVFAENDADSLAEFREALAMNQLSGYNILAADADHIYYSSGGRNGILNPGLPLNGALDGTDPDQAWQGILPFEQVPQAVDPPSGYYQNANNAPWYTAPGQIVRSEVPYYLAEGNVNGPRSRRQVELLVPLSNATLDEVGRLGMDNVVEFAPSLKALLAQSAVGGGPKVAAANALIEAWDGRAEKNSTAYPLFATWTHGLDESALGFSIQNPPPPATTFTSAQLAEARRAMNRAYDGMTAQYGGIAVRYGDLHTFSWGDFTGPVNGGDSDLPTVRLTNCKGEPGSQSPDYYHPCHVRGGSSFMFHTDLADGDLMRVSRPIADTADPSSRFYTLNARDYVADRYRSFPVTDEAVQREKTSQRHLRIPNTRPPRIRLRARRANVSGAGRVKIRVACRARKGERCRGNIVLERRAGRATGGDGKHARGARERRAKVLARGRFNLGRGHGTINARLRAPARRALRRQRTLRARLTLTVRDRGDVRRASHRVRLRMR